MPQAKQVTLSDLLTQLLSSTLADWHGPLPRLAYSTDKGSAPDEYYQRVLKKMRHPRAGQPLAWEWVLDFYHVCSYIGKLADALFGMATQAGAQWFAKMRRWLRDRPQGAAQVIRSAMQHLDRRVNYRNQGVPQEQPPHREVLSRPPRFPLVLPHNSRCRGDYTRSVCA